MLSYADDLYFGILADFDSVPDIDEFARGVERAVARLVAAARDDTRPVTIEVFRWSWALDECHETARTYNARELTA